jgi:hypothetical protein
MGLATAPRTWTKLLKPVFAELRKKNLTSVSYIDDSYLQGETFEKCLENVQQTVTLFDKLGLTVNTVKSVLVPSKQMTFFGSFTLL